MNTLYMVGNTHFDPVWLWTWDEAMASIRSTFRSALERMKEDPDFIYSFCTPAVFEWIEQVDPDMMGEIRARVKEGRWDIEAEGWWLQPDCNLPGGESLIRQALYGQRYLQRTFGRRANTVFNIDSFGHSAMIPQIMRKSGLSYYVFSRPTSQEMELEDNLFDWRSPDGSAVMAYRSGSNDAAGSYPQDVADTIRRWSELLPKMDRDAMQIYGVSDHGGAPTRQAIRDIRQAMEREDTIRVRFSSTGAFFAAQKDRKRPTVAGELPMRYYGAFSNHTETKRNNRRTEYALNHAEHASLMAGWLCGRAYPREKLYQCWKDLMFNQFHDILGGTCVPDAFTDIRNLHGRAMQNAGEEKHFALQTICRRIRTLGDNKDSVWNVCLFNLNGTPFRGVVEAEVQWAWEFPWYSGGIELEDENGNTLMAQVVTEKSAIPGFRTRFAFEAEVPAMGWHMYAVRKTNLPTERDYADEGLESPFLLRVFEDAGDVWCFNTMDGYGKALEEPVLTERRVAEKGPVLTRIRQTWKFRDSLIEEYITAYANDSRIDYSWRVNWNERHKVLKLIPKGAAPRQVTAAIPCGSIVRPADGHEYTVGEWMRWGEGKNGTTLLLDGVSAYDTDGGIRLTLLRSPMFGDLRMGPLNEREVRQYMEQGMHEGRISVISQAVPDSEAASLAAHWNGAPAVVCEANHPGDLPARFSSLTIEGNAVLSAMKRAEEGDCAVLRLVEMNGRAETTRMELNGVRAELTFVPHEIKTILINPEGNVRETDLLESEA